MHKVVAVVILLWEGVDYVVCDKGEARVRLLKNGRKFAFASVTYSAHMIFLLLGKAASYLRLWHDVVQTQIRAGYANIVGKFLSVLAVAEKVLCPDSCACRDSEDGVQRDDVCGGVVG